ncbi:MAG: DNA alkylation repair protein [Candidatus Omnitrophica bacterium]|nr:DNA alkylation repair protein [Candidatus Omnitrophota bacterium]MBU1047586.1 DNA alkylation repair protein [Candidatus Omnitrophota bacterium]MBU1631124.1 DNA alkylation repair protein [Candidatus Omnitrophota bacterium]MBU1766701.1 DNA alkylation repair protein [Candidatus Omnitrophota bacterium]MBU1888948.1 DNA alkylation repair protein [Candidatus Omnitrophota bacterium]
MNNIITDIRRKLKQNADKKTIKSIQKFFKEKIKAHGVKTPLVVKIAKEHFQHIKHKPKKDIFTLCEEFLKSAYMEESFIAYDWSRSLHKHYEPKDFKTFEKWVKKHVTNWAQCDTFCNHTIGTFIEKYPQFIKELKIWTKSKNRWVRRASAVTLILPARKGMFLKDIFEIADSLLIDEDDMVQKGYGWLLKVASHKHQKEVFDYVMKNKDVMPRTALRYAIEKMPEKMRAKAMARN